MKKVEMLLTQVTQPMRFVHNRVSGVNSPVMEVSYNSCDWLIILSINI